MGFIIPWEDPWWAEERGESVKLGYGPNPWYQGDRDGIQRMEIEYAHLDSMIDLLAAIKARRVGKLPRKGLIRIAVSAAAVDAAVANDADPWLAYQRVSLVDTGWPEEITHERRTYVPEPSHEFNYPVRDYYLKLREGLVAPRARAGGA